MLTQAYAAAQPRDIFEKIAIHQFVVIAWELLRLRRLKLHLQHNRLADGLERIFDFLPHDEFNELQEDLDGRQAAWPQLCAAAGQTMEHMRAEALANNLELFERLDSMIAKLEARSRATMRVYIQVRPAGTP